MKQSPKTIRQCLAFLTSRPWNLTLFILLVVLMIPRSMLPEQAWLFGPMVKIVLFLIGLDLLLCTLMNHAILAWPVLIIHAGFLVTMAASSLNILGYVATVNIHEGKSTSQAFRWDREKDLPLGFDLLVKRIGREWYPVEVKIGVLKNGVKSGLHETRTGSSLDVDGYRIRVTEFNLEARELLLSVMSDTGRQLGQYSTARGVLDLPPSFPLAFVLVAYKYPDLKRIWAELEIARDGRLLVAGNAEVNAPLVWREQGLRFYQTKAGSDDYGNPYAGLQIVKDPSLPYVYTGFAIIAFGCSWYFLTWLRKARKSKKL